MSQAGRPADPDANTPLAPARGGRRVADPGGVEGLARALRAGELTPTALLERHLARIEEVDAEVAAWCHVDADRARAEARLLADEAARGHFRGPLHGLPLAVKDIVDVEGMQTVARCRARADIAPATADAEVVAALRQAGVVVLGKAHTTEFAYFDPSPARNPHALEHTPGGSSSGSAAAVAAGMAPLALATQTVASTNRPAAYCGIAAFKPSTQLTCLHGLLPLAPSIDTVGCYARDVAGAVALFEAMCPPPLRHAPATPPPPETLSVVRIEDPILEGGDPESLAVAQRTQEKLEAHGHRVRTLRSPEPFEELLELNLLVLRYEAGHIHRRLLELPADQVGARLRELVEQGLALEPQAYALARRRITAARESFWEALADVDVLLFPATPTPAPPGLASTGDPRYIGPWTMLGGPVVTLPSGLHTNGLPLGTLLAGAPGTDRRFGEVARRVAAAAEQSAFGA